MEPQSAYWCHIQTGMYVLVAMFHIDDLTNIPDDEKIRLKEMLTAAGLPHVITESHIGGPN